MSSADANIGFLLNDVARLMRRNFNRRVQHLGLSQSQWRALGHLSKQEGINQVTLADQLEIQPITLARLIDRLQEAGFVERRPDPADRRAIRLYLTGQAGSLIAQLRQTAHAVRDETFGTMSAPEKAALIVSLEQMKLNLVDAEERGSMQQENPHEQSHVTGRNTLATRRKVDV